MGKARQDRLQQPPPPKLEVVPPPVERPTVEVPPGLMEELMNALAESQRANTALKVFREARGLQGYYRLVFPGAHFAPTEAPQATG